MVRLPPGLAVQPVGQKLWKMLPVFGGRAGRPAAAIQGRGGVKPVPQLVKGGKWVFGWVIVGPRGELAIPPEAWDEYRFQVGDEVTFISGSRRSGGFGLSHPRLLAATPAPLQTRALAQGRVDEAGRVLAPAAVRHPGLACFGEEART
jgi:hypothetical protein